MNLSLGSLSARPCTQYVARVQYPRRRRTPVLTHSCTRRGRLPPVLMRHPPPAICQNLGGGAVWGGVGWRVCGGGGGVGRGGRGFPREGGGAGLRTTHYYHMHTSRGDVCLGVWGGGGMYVIIALSRLCWEGRLLQSPDHGPRQYPGQDQGPHGACWWTAHILLPGLHPCHIHRWPMAGPPAKQKRRTLRCPRQAPTRQGWI